jgi:hypothetical protein
MSEPDLLDGLARWAALLGHGVYRPDTAYQAGEVAIVLGDVAPQPGELLALRVYASGPEPDSRLPYSESSVQWRIRGGADERSSRARAVALWSGLHGAGPVELPGGVFVMSVICLQGDPIPLGRDEQGRHEHVVNTRIEYVRESSHRTA